MYLSIFLIGMFLGALFFVFLQSERTYSGHYYEYYLRSVLIDSNLKDSNFGQAMDTFFASYPDKIIPLRNLLFFFFFGPSHMLFSFSSVFLHIALTLFLFYVLTKIYDLKKSFIITLLIISCFFYIELYANFYVDLAYFLACSIFFVIAALFRSGYKGSSYLLLFAVFLLFTIKNASYLFVPLVSAFIFIEGLLNKNKPLPYVLRYLCIMIAGFILFFAIFLNASLYRILADIPTIGDVENCNPNEGRCNSFQEFSSNFSPNLFIYSKTGMNLLDWHMFMKFENLFLILLLYAVVVFNLIKKRNAFFLWLFFAGELFFFILFNIIGSPYDLRLMLPFYFIYLYLIIDFFYLLSEKLSKKTQFVWFLSFAIILFLYSISTFFIAEKRAYSERYFSEWLFLDAISFERDKIYINSSDAKEISAYYRSFIDRDENFTEFEKFYDFDKRFRYRITDNESEADYVLCHSCIEYSSLPLIKSGSLRGESSISLYNKTRG